MAILYISYDGILEPLGSSQVLNYLNGIASKDKEIILLSYEKISDLIDSERVHKLQKKLSKDNIEWKFLKYHKNPAILASIFDLFCGFLHIIPFLFSRKIKIIHIRGYMPMLLGLLVKIISSGKLIFDTRGFWPDEKADRSNWSRASKRYKFFKNFERICLRYSDKVICLTHQAKDIYIEMMDPSDFKKIEVIRTCTDLKKFYVNIPSRHSTDVLNFGYLGSIDTAYDISKVFKFFNHFLNHKDANLYIFTNGSKEELNLLIDKYDLPKDHIYIRKIGFDEVSEELNLIDIGIFYLNINFSIKASMPTKIGEFFSKGIPIICNKFNKDIEKIINKNNGYLLNFKKIEHHDLKKIEKLADLDRNKIHEFARKNFSLEQGIQQYKEVYEELDTQ